MSETGTTTSLLDVERFNQWCEAIGFERYSEVSGHFLLFMPKVVTDGKGGRRDRDWNPVRIRPGDAGQLQQEIESRLTAETWGVYLSLGIFGEGGRKKADLLAITGFNLDIDIAGAAHKKGDVADSNEAEEFISSLPLPPSLVTHSGYGLHGLMRLDEPLTDLDAAQRIADGLAKFGTGRIDGGPLKNWATTNTRVGGCPNNKLTSSGPVAAVLKTGSTHSRRALLEAFPAPPRTEKPKRKNFGELARDRFAASQCAADMLMRVFGAKVKGGFVNIPNDEGYSESPSVHHYHGSESGEACTVFDHGGERTGYLASLLPEDERASVRLDAPKNAFDVLALKVGFRAAVGLVETFESEPGRFDLMAIVERASNVDQARAEFG